MKINKYETLLVSTILFLLTVSLIYYYIEERSTFRSFYDACMLISLNGQDDAPETDLGKILIGPLAILSALYYAIYIWMIIESPAIKLIRYLEKYLPRYLILFISLIVMLFTVTLAYYITEDRTLIQSWYGACMLISLNGQDDTPETDNGLFLIGILSLVSSMFYAVFAWTLVEPYVRKHTAYQEIDDYFEIT